MVNKEEPFLPLQLAPGRAYDDDQERFNHFPSRQCAPLSHANGRTSQRSSLSTSADVSYVQCRSRPESVHLPPNAATKDLSSRIPSDVHSTTPSQPSVYFVGRLTKDAFVHITSSILDRTAELNSNSFDPPISSDPESVFFSVSRPEIPTRDYIRRLVTYMQCSPAAFVVMLVYLDRIGRKTFRLQVTPFNMHRLLVTALTLACKTLDDRCFSNVHYAKVGGIPTFQEMNRLEVQFLKYLDYRLHVNVDTYFKKQQSLEAQPPRSPVSVIAGPEPVRIYTNDMRMREGRTYLADPYGDVNARFLTSGAPSQTGKWRGPGRVDRSLLSTRQ